MYASYSSSVFCYSSVINIAPRERLLDETIQDEDDEIVGLSETESSLLLQQQQHHQYLHPEDLPDLDSTSGGRGTTPDFFAISPGSGPSSFQGLLLAQGNVPQQQQSTESSSPKKKLKCRICGKEFSQLRNFKYHMSRHEGTQQFACRCPECGKFFNDKGYLSSHLKIHRNEKEYKCEWCNKSFNQRVAYNMHIRIHTGHKPHKCSFCSKAFSRKMLLRQHIRTHTGSFKFKQIKLNR